MKKQSQLGLVIEGKAKISDVLRLARQSNELGPVKSSTKGVARRTTNGLRAGHPVEEYDDLQTAGLILLLAPDAAVPRIVDELCGSELVMKEMSFVLCESWLCLDALAPLKQLGASTATLLQLPTPKRNWYAVEGDAKAVRQTRRFLKRHNALSDELKLGTKYCLFVSQLLASALPVTFLNAAQTGLRVSGFSGNNLSLLLEQITAKMLQDFLRGSRSNWNGTWNACPGDTRDYYLEQWKENNPELASLLHQHLTIAQQARTS